MRSTDSSSTAPRSHWIPLQFDWRRHSNPLPTRVLHLSGRSSIRHQSPRPFDLSECLRRLCTDIARRSPQLAHIDVSRLLIGMTPARNRSRFGLQARVTPLRFEHGQLLRERHGTLFGLQRFFVDGRELLYHIAFCLPRFLDQEFHEKLITVFHELYHIDPRFNGDLRRHAGRCCLHSHSRRRYDEYMDRLVRAYLTTAPEPALLEPLRLNCRQLVERHGAVQAVAVARPKIVPLVSNQRRRNSKKYGRFH